MAKSANSWLFKMRRLVFMTIGGVLCTSQQTHAKFDGFYVGSSVGYLQQNTSINAKQNPANPNAHVNNTDAQKGLPTVEIFLGWGKVFGSCFYGGLEGKIDWALGGNSKVAEDTVFKFSANRMGPGLSIVSRLGYLIDDRTMLYGAIGMKLLKFMHSQFEKGDNITAAFSQRSVRLFTEMGVEMFPYADKKLGFRVSYSHMPKKFAIRQSREFPVNHMYYNNGVLRTGMSEHTFKIGAIYRF